MKTKLILLVLLMALFVIFGCSTTKKLTTQQALPPAVDTGGVTQEYIDIHWLYSVSERVFYSKHPKRGRLKELSPDEVSTYCKMAVEKHPRIKTGIKKGEEGYILLFQRAECADSLRRYSAKAEE